jgi:hypothetical protein
MEKKVLIEEINRMRTIMGLNLLTEGNIFGEAANIWKTLLTKEASALTAEEKEILQKMINRVSEFSQAGIKNVDELLSTQGKEVLRQVLRTTKDEISDALKRSLDEVTTTRIKNIMTGVDNSFKTAMGGVAIPGSGTISDIISKIELKGVNSVPETILDTTIVQLNGLKGSLSDVQQKYVDDITNEINNHLDTKSRNFADEAVAAGGETAWEKTARESEEKLTELIKKNAEIDELLKYFKALDSYRKLKSRQKTVVDNYIRTQKAAGKTNEQITSGAATKINDFISDSLTRLNDPSSVKSLENFKGWVRAIAPSNRTLLIILGILLATGTITLPMILKGFKNARGKDEEWEELTDDSDTTSDDEYSTEGGLD